MRYIKVEFTAGLEMVAYQEVDDHGQVVAYIDEVGQEFLLPMGVEFHVVEEMADSPFVSIMYLPKDPMTSTITINKDTLMYVLTQSLVNAEIPQQFIDQITHDLFQNIG
jgi:hypothetical protein